MVRKLHLLLTLLIAGHFAMAQNNPICVVPVAAESCDEACINCDFGGAGGSTGGFAADGANGFCSGIQNDQWYGFIAGRSVDVTFTLSPSNCTNGDGVQIALYPNCSSGFLACDGGGTGQGNTPISITAGLIEGQTYFLIIDGFGGDVCNFALSVSPASAVRAPTVRPAGPIIGPSKVCPGATVQYTITPAQGAQFYTWTIPPDATINGLPGPGPHTFEVAEGTNVEITFGNSGGAISVEPTNACRRGSLRTKPVTVAPIPPLILPTVDVCFNEFPYGLPWGNDANNPGTFTETLVTPAGCDSVVTITLRGRPAYNNPPVPRFVCADKPCLNICGTEYCAPASVSAQCKTFKYDCDSIVNLEMVILNPTADIRSSSTLLTCANNRIVLRSAPSATGSVKTWRTLAGGLLGTGDTLVVTTPGSYVLNVTMSSQTTSCTKLDTVKILSDLLPPANTPTASGQIGCGGVPVTLSTTTNVANPSYIWTGPAGFTLTTQPSPTTLITGIYTVVVRSPLNGCTSSATVEVKGSTTPPDITTTTNTLTCANTATGVTISANTTVPGATYNWAGASLSSTTVPNPTVTISGIYTVTVTNPQNNCTATATVNVNLDNAPPTPSASTLGTISCTTPSVNVTTTPATGVTYLWNNNSTAQNPSVTTAGTYTVTVRNNSNGCTATATTTVTGDVLPPNASTNGGLINCATTSIVLTGTSATSGATFSWSGPVTSNGATVTANAAGVYTLTVRGPNACTSTASATVVSDVTPPGASATGGVVSCSSTSVELKGNSPTAGVTYSWAGPGTPGPVQNPVVSLPGTYTLTVRGPNGCTSTAMAEVTADAGTPQVMANGGTLTCANPTVTLTATATPAGVQLQWINPLGQLLPSTTPVVSLKGVYVVKAVNPNNGCEIEANVNVLEDKTPPGATATGGTVSCKDATITISGTSPATGVTSWAWSGPGGFASNIQNPNNVTASGPYVLTVRGANGCTSTTTATVLEDKIPPTVSAAGAVLTCDNPSRTITSTSSVPSTYSWSGPGTPAFTSTQQNPVVNLEGTYRVTITSNANGCTSTTSAPVDLDKTPPGVTATGDTLTCTKQQVTITATPGTGTPTYSWAGTGISGNTAQNPSASTAGIYTVTAKAANGCTSTATAEVFENKEKPTITNQTPDIITCANDTITIDATVTNAQSPVTGVVWTSGGGFNSAAQDPMVFAPGNYTIVATSANGCTSEKVIAVTEDKAAPNISATGATLDCAVTSVRITGSSTTPGATFAWTGNNFSAAQQSAQVSNPGIYTLVVTAPNGCTASTTATVNANINAPNISSTKSDDLDCNVPAIILTAASTTTGVTYEWSDPAGTPAGTQPALNVTAPGRYVIKVTAPNGCISRDTQVVTQDIVKPDVNATGALITCADPTPSIAATSTTTGVTYSWASSVAGFTSALQNPQVTQNGTYTVTAKAPNGCTQTAETTVNKDVNIPDIQTETPAVLTCKDTASAININITLPSSITQTGLSWSSSTGSTFSTEDISVTQPGTYTVKVTSSNGCQVTTSVVVTQDINAPGATATAGTLTCANPSFTLKGASPLPATDVTWAWTGPTGLTFNVQEPLVTEAGTYTLIVTSNKNGCTSQTTTELLADKNAPVASAASPDTLTCKKTAVGINASSSLTATYKWEGPGFSSILQNPTNVTTPGTYTVTVTANVNGCTGTQIVEVVQNIEKPDAVMKGDTLSCNRPNVPISVTTTAPGPRYAWSGPTGTLTNTTANPSVSAAGSYAVTVTGFNGCTTVATVSVLIDSVRAVIIGTPDKILTCTDQTVGINATVNSASPVVSTTWSGPSYTSSVEDPADITRPGLYTLTVRPANGCTSSRQIEVKQDTLAPRGVTTKGDTLTCLKLAVNLASNSTTTNVTYAWSGPGTYKSNSQNPLDLTVPGTYTVTVTGANGCTTAKTAIIAQNVNPPGATATSSLAQLDCDDLEAQLTGASTTTGVSYVWNGPGLNDPKQNSKTTRPGSYILVVTAPNSCISRDTVVITQDIQAPNATATGGVINCTSSQTVITGASTTPNVTYSWAGPNQTTFQGATPTVTQPGTYTLTVKGANACTDTATAIVNPNLSSPIVTLSGEGTLTCAVGSLLLKATVNAPVSPVSTTIWTNASGATVSSSDTLRATVPGVYTFTAVSQNGCKSAPTATVLQDIVPPQDLKTTGGKLDCNFPTTTISVTSATQGVTYAWSGPGGAYSSTLPNPSDVKTAGTYTVIVTNPINGCSASATAVVTEDPTKPVLTAKTDTLTCTRKTVTLDATTNTAGATFQWTGPITSTLEDPTTAQAGVYRVVAKGPNGCTSEFSITVPQNIENPNLSVQGDTITCATNSGVVTAASTTSGVRYAWTGPGTFSSTQAAPVVTAIGTYTVVVTALNNGCTTSRTVQVAPDQNAPVISAKGGIVTCAVPSLTLSATSNTNVDWNWTGPNGFTSALANPTANAPGNYTVEATSLSNRCKVSTSVEIKADQTPPVVTLSEPAILTCTVTEVDITASTGSAGVYSFVWGGGNIVSGGQAAIVRVSAAGDYQVTVTNTQNGCTTVRTAQVDADPATPSGLGLNNRDISCFGAKNGAIIIDSVKGGTAPILFSLNGSPFSNKVIYTNLSAGTYTLEVEDANGCTFSTTFDIKEPEELIVNLGKDTSIVLGESISLSLDDIVNDPKRVATTKVFPAGIDSLINNGQFMPLKSLLYQVTVIDSNGCRASDERRVLVDKTRHIFIPEIFAPGSTKNNNFFIQTNGRYDDVKNIKSFMVFDRWGNALHEASNFLPNDPDSGWNGKIGGREVGNGVYVYYAEIEFIDGETVLYKGDVTVLR
jgi:hypothetical protein